MATPAQQYVNSFFNQGRLSTGGGLSNDQGLEGGLNRTATAGALGATAVFPAVVNNMSYADDYNNLTKSVNAVGKAGGIYSGYKTALGLMDSGTGSDQFANTFSPGNMLRSGFETASYLNPITGVLSAVNSLTRDEDTPQGTIPGVSFVQGKVDAMADAINKSQLGTAISRGARNIYDKTIAPVVQSRPGQIITSGAGVPLGLAESGYSTLREGYQALDRGLFGGYLPFGARDDDPETQRFDNPLDTLTQSFNRFKNTIQNDQRQVEGLPVQGRETINDFRNTELDPGGVLLQDTKDYTAEELRDQINNPTAKQDMQMNLGSLAEQAEALGYDMDSKGVISAGKQPITSNDLGKWANTIGSYPPYGDPNGERKPMRWVTETRPDKIDIDLDFKNVDGYSTFYKAGTNIPFENTREYGEFISGMDRNTFLEYMVYGALPDKNYADKFYDYKTKNGQLDESHLYWDYAGQVGRAHLGEPFEEKNRMAEVLKNTTTQAEYQEQMGYNSAEYKNYRKSYPGPGTGRTMLYTGAKSLAKSGVMGTFYTEDGRKVPLENTRDQAIDKQVSDHVLNSAVQTANASQYFQNQMNQMDDSFYQTDYNMSNPIDNYMNNLQQTPLQNIDYNLPNNYDSINF
jgi:hypothetical protein